MAKEILSEHLMFCSNSHNRRIDLPLVAVGASSGVDLRHIIRHGIHMAPSVAVDVAGVLNSAGKMLGEKNDLVRTLIRQGLPYEGSAQKRVEEMIAANLVHTKYVNMSFRWMLKNLPLSSSVLVAVSLASPDVVEAILMSLLRTDSWGQMENSYGIEGAELYTLTADESRAIVPATATATSPNFNGTLINSTTTQGTTMTNANTSTTTVTALKSMNAAVKPLIDGVLAQAGVSLTVDKIADVIDLCVSQTHKLTELEKSLDDAKAELRKASSNASKATTLTVAASGVIPSGSMAWVQAETLFPQMAGVKLDVPHFSWGGDHPDVPAINNDYIFRKEMLVKALRCLASGENVWLAGHTGSGKTTFVEQIAARLGWPVARVAFDSNVDRSELVGRMQLSGDGKGGTTSSWLAGVLERSIANNYILLCDELDAGHPNALYTLQPILEGRPLTLLEDGGRVVPFSPMARIFATGNTTGNGDPSGLYPACRILSAATLDRFPNFINVPYMTTDEEEKLIDNATHGLSKSMLKSLVKFGKELREAFVTGQTPISYSPRRSVAFAREVCDLMGMGYKDEKAVLTAAFKSKLYDAASEEFRQRITEIANACFGGGIDPTKSLT